MKQNRMCVSIYSLEQQPHSWSILVENVNVCVEYQSIMIFLWRANQSGPLQKKKKNQKLNCRMHSQLINMNLQEGMVIKHI